MPVPIARRDRTSSGHRMSMLIDQLSTSRAPDRGGIGVDPREADLAEIAAGDRRARGRASGW
jgi:hypothetical protein